MQLTGISLFSGALGLDLGMRSAGVNIAAVCENDRAAAETIRLNEPSIPNLDDAWKVDWKAIKRATGLNKRSQVDIIFGGPPCQAFSSAGKRQGIQDERGGLVMRFVEIVEDVRPRFCVMENVRGLLSAPLAHRPHDMRGAEFPSLTSDELPGGVLALVLARLRDAGYEVKFNLYNAANYGAPQIRERIVLIGALGGRPVPYLRPSHAEEGAFGLRPWATFRDAVESLAPESHEFIPFPEKRLRFYRLLGPGQYWKHLPPDLQQEALGKSYFSGGGKTGFLRRLAWDRPSPTLVTNPAMPATDLCHPVALRPLSVQEYMRLQGFPDTWRISGKVLDAYRQIGNAVPVQLGRAIGSAILSFESGVSEPDLVGFPYSRYRDTSDVTWAPVSPSLRGPSLFVA